MSQPTRPQGIPTGILSVLTSYQSPRMGAFVAALSAAAPPLGDLQAAAIEALNEVKTKAGPAVDAIKRRLGKAKTVRFVAQILTAALTAGVVGTVIADQVGAAKVIAVITLVASVLPFLADYWSTATASGTSLLDIFKAVVDCMVKAPELLLKIKALDPADPATEPDLRQLINEANTLCEEFQRNMAQL